MDAISFIYHEILEMLTDWPLGTLLGILVTVCIVFVIGFTILLLFFIVDQSLGHNEIREGIVIEKSYTPSSTGTGVGPSIGGSGGVAVVVTSTSAKYILFVRLENESIDEVHVDREEWLETNKGERFMYSVKIGRFSKM